MGEGEGLLQVWLRFSRVALITVALIFVSGFAGGAGSSEPAAPAPPDRSRLAAEARQIAEQTLAGHAAGASATAHATSAVAALAVSAARQSANNRARLQQLEMGGEARLRPSSRSFVAPPTATATALPVATATPTATAAPARAAPPQQMRVPILMYHHVADAPPGADAVRRDLSVSPAAFDAQMAYLKANGYQTISLADLADCLTRGRVLPPKAVVLTFDDGYNDNYTLAMPILLRYGFSGTFFVITDSVGSAGYVSWPDVESMSRQGMVIQPHGRTHADLAVSSASDVRWQVTGSRAAIEEKVGQPAQFFCYPSGRYTAQTIASLQASGYIGAVTTTYGATQTKSGLFELSRVRIRGGDSIEQFVLKLTTAP